MEIERCLREGDDWRIRVSYKGQPIEVWISRENIDDLIPGENPSEAHVVEALRAHHATFERAVNSVVQKRSGFVPTEFSSIKLYGG